jgi:6-pyruvoyltetrahydropterin/6-carboxytetrahydropterin synthase
MQAMAARIRDQDLEAIRPAEAEAVTVEVLARWAHGELGAAIRQSGAETLSVRVWETPADFGGYAGPLP